MNKLEFTEVEMESHRIWTGHRHFQRMGFPDTGPWTCVDCAKKAIEEQGICEICRQLGWDVAVSGPLFRGVAHSKCWGDLLAEAEAYIRNNEIKGK